MIKKSLLLFSIFALLVTSGCILMSGTFTVTESFSFNLQTGFYPLRVNLTDEEDWDDHKDEIDRIDLIGFEIFMTNDEDNDITLNLYIDDAENPLHSNYTLMRNSAIRILDHYELEAGPNQSSHITYGESFQYLENIEELKEFAKQGKFNLYGVTKTGGSSAFKIDSGKVVITFTAHD